MQSKKQLYLLLLKTINNATHLKHQGDPDEKHHESIKHTPAIFHIGVVTLKRVTEKT